jgi:hypothetical protein
VAKVLVAPRRLIATSRSGVTGEAGEEVVDMAEDRM